MYHLLAPYYDLIHEKLTADIDFVLDLAVQYGGPILELGCGTGRVLLPLVRKGYQVIGVDNENSMLDRARKRLAQEPENVQELAQLIQVDLLRLKLPESQAKFGLALFTYNTALHFPTKELRQILSGLRPCILEDGRLFLDYANPYVIESSEYEEEEPEIEQTFIDPANGVLVTQKSLSHLDFSTQCLRTNWILQMKDGPEQPAFEVSYYYQFPHQLELILRQTGFRLERILGDYAQSDFNEESERLLVIARPAG